MFFVLSKKNTALLNFKDLELHTIELNKFSHDHHEELTTLKTSLNMWSAFLTQQDLMRLRQLPPGLDNESLKKALTVFEVMSFNEAERYSYDDHPK